MHSKKLPSGAMDLHQFISEPTRRAALAAATDSNPDYLWQVATGRRRASTALAKEIETASAAIGPEPVPRWSVRPDVWEPPAAAA